MTVFRAVCQHARHQWFTFMVKVLLGLMKQTDQSSKEVRVSLGSDLKRGTALSCNIPHTVLKHAVFQAA